MSLISQERLKKNWLRRKKAVAILGGEIENVTGFELPGGEGSRSLIKIRENETDFGKVSEKSGTSRKRAAGSEMSMKPVTCELESAYLSDYYIKYALKIRLFSLPLRSETSETIKCSDNKSSNKIKRYIKEKAECKL